jgi:hypothetical protein
MVATAIVMIVILGHVSSTVAQHNLAQSQRARSEILRCAGEFLERLRGEEDWAGLYARLRYLQGNVASSGIADRTLADGRRTYLPATYFPGFVSPPPMTVLVDVPSSPDEDTGVLILREDASLPDYLLPADLNGDGVVEASARDADYAFLPVRVTFRWDKPVQGGREQFTVLTWLEGER